MAPSILGRISMVWRATLIDQGILTPPIIALKKEHTLKK